MGAVVIQHKMQVQLRRRCHVGHFQKIEELHRAVTPVALAEHLSGDDVEHGKQAGHAVSGVVMGAPLHLPGAHRRHRLAAAQGLDLALLIHTQNQCMVRRVEIQPDDVPYLIDQKRVAGELKRLCTMRFETESAPDAADCRLYATSQRTDVLVQNGHITAVGHHLKASPKNPSIDASGDTLLPGLIDSHTHAYGNALEEALVFGVTTELDMFTDPRFAAEIKSEQFAGKGLNLADLRSAGTLATVPGGHGTEYGVDIPTLTSPNEAQAWVDARIQGGSDYIKLVYDDYRAYGTLRPTLSKETMRAVIDAAHRRGKMAVVHIGDQQGAFDAIDAGADGLAHLFADSAPLPDFARIAAAHHIFVVPTLTVLIRRKLLVVRKEAVTAVPMYSAERP